MSARRAPVPPYPQPRLRTLTLLVGRMTTIKLAYWAALTAFEVALPAVLSSRFVERFPFSVAAAAIATLLAIVWSVRSARAADQHLGRLWRSIPTVATTFVAANVVAAPASLPLLVVERNRSIEGCAPATCNWEALALWVAVTAIGMVVLPAAFAISLRTDTPPDADGTSDLGRGSG